MAFAWSLIFIHKRFNFFFHIYTIKNVTLFILPSAIFNFHPTSACMTLTSYRWYYLTLKNMILLIWIIKFKRKKKKKAWGKRVVWNYCHTRDMKDFFFFFKKKKVKEQKKNFFCNSLEKKIFLKFKEKMYIFQ